MQTMGVTGKIFNLKSSTTQNGKPKVTFRLSVRKRFVSDNDKQANKVNTFLPMVAMGPTAEFIQKFFKDGELISVYNMEYQTYRTQNAPNEYDDAHIFKVDNVGFVQGGNEGQSGGQSQTRSNNNQANNTNNNAGGYGGGYGGNQQPATAGAGAGGYGGAQPSDDLPF